MPTRTETSVENLIATFRSMAKTTTSIKPQLEGMISNELVIAKNDLYVNGGYKDQDELITDQLNPDYELGKKIVQSMVLGFDTNVIKSVYQIQILPDSAYANPANHYPNGLPASSNLNTNTNRFKREFLSAIDALETISSSILDQITELTAQVALNSAASANALATTPPQPGVVAERIYGFNAMIKRISASFSPLLPSLNGLSHMGVLFGADIIDQVDEIVATLIDTINTSIETLATFKLP